MLVKMIFQVVLIKQKAGMLNGCKMKTKTRKLFYLKILPKNNLNDFFSIPGNYRYFVYCAAIRNGGNQEWEFASAQYDKEIQASQRRNIQRGMACTKQPWLISRYLNDQINSTKVRLQDATFGIQQIAMKSSSNLRTWMFVKDNWDHLISTYVAYFTFR